MNLSFAAPTRFGTALTIMHATRSNSPDATQVKTTGVGRADTCPNGTRRARAHWVMRGVRGAVAAAGLLVLMTTNACGDEPAWIMLTNGNVLRGQVESQGQTVILHRPDGSQLRLTAQQVAHASDSLIGLYRYRSQLSSVDANWLIENVRWCLRNELLAEAEVELARLHALDPSHPEGGRLARQIEIRRTPPSKVEMSYPKPEPTPAPDDPLSPDVANQFSPQAIAEFAARVQPLLVNRCGNAGCHRSGSTTQWQLSHLGVSVRVSSRTTQRNLLATSPYLNRSQPLDSELLNRATDQHALAHGSIGAMRAAKSVEATLTAWLENLNQPASATLELENASALSTMSPGVAQASYRAPVPLETLPIASPVLGAELPAGFSMNAAGDLIYEPPSNVELDATTEQPNEPALVPIDSQAETPVVPVPPSGQPKQARPRRLPAVDNPFSADLFNRQHRVLP